MNKTTKRIVISSVIAGALYGAWRIFIKPRVIEKRVQKMQQYQQNFDSLITPPNNENIA
jgi:hypothetical protein